MSTDDATGLPAVGDPADPVAPPPVPPAPENERGLARFGWFKGLPREVGVLSSVAFCVALGFGIVGPAIPIFADEFGVTAFWASAVVSDAPRASDAQYGSTSSDGATSAASHSGWV